MRLFLLRPDGSIIAGDVGNLREESDQALRQREIVQQFLRMRGRSEGVRAYEIAGPNGERRRMVGAFAATSHSWGVFVEVDEELALAPVKTLGQLMTVVAALAVGLAGAVALLLHGAVSRPIKRLAQISTRLAEGDFAVQARAPAVTELDALALNFNLMARRLGELVERFRATARDANDMFLGIARALADAIDEKDPYTKGHSVRVNLFAVIIGRYLGLSREQMRDLQISSLLHDVGKIGVDDAILKKPGALSPDEYEVMKTHPERGARIMGRIPKMKDIIPGMRFHHERYQGGGYPFGLSGEEIPLLARIIAVADVFDAMITERPYQKAFPVTEAVDRINKMKSKKLDPQVVEAFTRAYGAGEFEDVLANRTTPAPESRGAPDGDPVKAPAP
jgi:HD-GYP domain-containing protein (c-di-GMP phosphodiesterase class II)